ncbi:MAG: hypothetical protein FJW40_10910 [Acidobacteria bacterium]|nr:hypothetical protein [Acidobacteriota bacterium]
MVVGQDWGEQPCFERNVGHEPPNNRTNHTLMRLLESIGIRLDVPSRQDDGGGVIFLTNAILCLKTGGMQGATRQEWFENCGRRFLRQRSNW